MSSEEKQEESVFTPSRTITVQCERVLFGRDFRLVMRDVPLVLDTDGESAVLTFLARGRLTGCLLQRVFHGGDIMCVRARARARAGARTTCARAGWIPRARRRVLQ